MINNKVLSLSALALSLSLTQTSVFAESEGMQHCFHGERLHKIVDELNLTPEQKEKIHSIRDNARETYRAKFKEIRSLRMQINEAFKSGPVDETKMDSFVNQKKEIVGVIFKTRLMERNDISNVLTDQQRQKLYELIQKWEDKHQEFEPQ